MPLSFSDFFVQLMENPTLLLTTLLLLGVLLVNGWTDAPNAISAAVVTGALPFRRAALLAAGCNFLGVLCVTKVNASVAETVYSIAHFGGGPKAALTALCAAMTAIVLWAGLAWAMGIPTSESHALLAGISGAAAALEGNFSCINPIAWTKVLLGLGLSLLMGFWAGEWSRRQLDSVKWNNHTFLLAQIPGAAGAAFLHGAQDGQKCMGVFLLGSALARGDGETAMGTAPVWLMGLCAGCMALGTLMGGRKIIDTLGRDMVDIGPREGLAADGAVMVCLLLSTLLGLPVSTTHTRTAALLGVSCAGGCRPCWAVAGRVALVWLLTFPACMAIGYWTAQIFLSLL